MATIASTELKKDTGQSLERVPHWIGGKTVAGEAKSFAEVFNPATGEVKRRVPLDSAAELEQAVAAATAAFPEWSSLPPLRRARVLFRFRDLLEKNTDRLAAIITSEHGKVLDDAPFAEGRVHGAGGHRDRQLVVSAAAGRGGRHYSFQLSGHGSAVDASSGHCDGKLFHSQAQRTRSFLLVVVG
jgi:hypothetical protein